MSDLISKKALIKVIETIEARYGNDNSSLIEQGEVLDLIEESPTIDAEPVRHGHWIEKELFIPWCDDDVDIIYECSCCGTESGEPPQYCPNCGAKMDE